MFLAGQYLYPNKQVRIAVRVFQGIGLQTSEVICNKALIFPFCKVCDLKGEQIEKLKELIEEVQERERRARIVRMKRVEFLATLKPKRIVTK